MKKTLYITILALAIPAVGGAAANNGTQETMTTMNEVVVTATRQAEDIATVPANITVISEQQIARSTAETVPDLLRTVEGVLINDISGNGRTYTVDLRGFGETAGVNTLVLIDGRRINQVDLSATDWTLIPLEQVERIEIVRGSRGSVLYGDNAAGGVINIITKRGKETKLTGGLAGGSYDTLLANAGISGSSDTYSYSLSANYQESDGYRDNSDTEAKNAGLNLEYFAADALTVTLSGGYHEDDARMPGAITRTNFNNGVVRTASLHPNDYANTKDYYVQAVPQFFFTDSSYIQLDASFRTRKADSYISFSSGSSLYTTDIDTVALSPQIVVKKGFFGRASTLTLGFDFNKNRWKAYNEAVFFGTPSSLTGRMTKTESGFYAHEEFSITDKLLLSGGARHDKATYKFPANASPEKSDLDEDLYTAGATYRFTDDLSAFVNYSRNFRYPLLDELFDIFTNTFNANLTSQTGDDIEVGILFQSAADMTLGLTVFRTETENEIYYNPFTFTNANLDGDGIRQGVEMKASKRFSKVQISGSYTFRDTNIEGGTFDGKEVPDVPKHQFTVGADLQPCTNVHLSLNGSYIGKRIFISDFANDHEKQDDYFYLTGKVSYTLPKGTVYVSMNNLLNEKYSEYGVLEWTGDEGFYPSPDFNFLVGLNLQF
jgi:iron complex outermembrane receptor protein